MRHLKSFKSVAMVLAVVLTAACGDNDIFTGGGIDPTQGGGAGSGAVKLSTLTLLADAPTLSSDASGVAAGIQLTALARDVNNNVVPDVTVVFSTGDSAEINVSNPAVTDANGRVTAVLTTGGDQTNRSITVTASGNGLSDSVTVAVVGTQIDISGPSGTQFGVPTEYVISLTDAAGNGIAGRTVQISTEPENVLSATSLDSDGIGQVVVEFQGNLQNSTLTASALGLSTSLPIAVSPDDFTIGIRKAGDQTIIPLATGEVPELVVGDNYEVVANWERQGAAVGDGQVINFGATRGQLAGQQDATSAGVASVGLLSQEAGLSILTAFSDQLSKPNARMTVEFVATNPTKIEVQASPPSVPRNQTSEIIAIVRDPSNNLVKNATVDFSLSDQTSGSLSTPTAVTDSQGLARVTYSASSQASATEGVIVTGQVRGANNVSDSIAITVGGTAADIALGTGSKIIVKDETTYQLPFSVVVTDSAGNPVPDAQVSLTLFATQYFEGTFGDTVACANEDLNRNDIFDATDDDRNNNGTLEPGRRASIPTTVALDDAGSAQFLVTYPKTDGQFVSVEITASVRVAGTESTEKRRFKLGVAAEDVDNLPGVSPFGVDKNCLTSDPPDL